MAHKTPQVGFEPTTNRLTADRSTPELLRKCYYISYYTHIILELSRAKNTKFWLLNFQKEKSVKKTITEKSKKPKLLHKAGDAIRTRDINLGKVALYHWATPANALYIIIIDSNELFVNGYIKIKPSSGTWKLRMVYKRLNDKWVKSCCYDDKTKP